MAKEKFEDRSFTGTINVACKFDDGTVRHWTGEKEEIINRIISIVNEFSEEGYTLTLRQLHYQMVKNNWIVNHISAYQKLSGILDDCRYGGIIDWDAIEDRGRVPFIPYSINNPKEALQDTINQYRIDRQDNQKVCVEVWTEKDALSGILRRITTEYHVRLVVNKGYTSSSAIYTAYERIVENILKGKTFVILYLGDHDPSGLDMIRDIQERLILFLTKGDQLFEDTSLEKDLEKWWENNTPWGEVTSYMSRRAINALNKGENYPDYAIEEFYAAKRRVYIEQKELFQVIPIGLTQEQIKKHKLPPNPTKLTDSRSDSYIKEFGKICWEVDALNPKTLTEIVQRNIQVHVDMNLFHENVAREKKDIKELTKILKNELEG